MRNKILVGALLALIAGPAAADKLIVSSEKAGRANAIGLDLQSDGRVSGGEFRINVGEGAKVDLSSCLKALPKTHAGQCSYAKGKVIGLFFSDTNAVLPAGLYELGTIRVTAKGGARLNVEHFLVADAAANRVDSSVETTSENIEMSAK